MVVFVMGAPRGKNGAPANRPIISSLRDVLYHQCMHATNNSQKSLEVLNSSASTSDKFLSTSSQTIPMLRQSYADAIDEVFEAERLYEIRRQKELMLQAYLHELEELVNTPSLTRGQSGSALESDSVMCFFRWTSPWKHSYTPSSFHTGRALLYIHESSQLAPLVPCRGDLVYATLKHRSVAISGFSESCCLMALPLTLPPMDAERFATIALEEMMARHELLLREDRLRQRISGREVGAFLRVQLVIRTNARFHQTRLSSLEGIRRKELEYLRDGIFQRAKKQEEEHRKFMYRLPPERLMPLKIPTLTSSGHPYAPTAVDHEVARALAVEERTWKLTGRRKKSFFPPIV
ncbi:hypothetical protein TraAM80_02443 [Trypanosoma rangeli]|uniref:Uncharacterized protein n=1 Tax=Trypanosoma rangeli TaxID=5698 RepID=A0A3S5IRU5_TRYRA|nr:uncharacterized protein TraAM80_02443 [Trypanosoma rangeli]RNF08898.1 hypothetical protein TraAM80_02443 [Trypanosoma rangeli]|eukprot:RNF08898.1 hypothetical protein TraAM80_02443 [Trypanosoma rangeli]